jgi:hypothetical protein
VFAASMTPSEHSWLARDDGFRLRQAPRRFRDARGVPASQRLPFHFALRSARHILCFAVEQIRQ